jgi:hypothetical protein
MPALPPDPALRRRASVPMVRLVTVSSSGRPHVVVTTFAVGKAGASPPLMPSRRQRVISRGTNHPREPARRLAGRPPRRSLGEPGVDPDRWPGTDPDVAGRRAVAAHPAPRWSRLRNGRMTTAAADAIALIREPQWSRPSSGRMTSWRACGP